jgi:limonene-1,2-epoxide hydrolase
MSARKVVDDFIAAWKTMDIDKVMGFLSSDCAYHNIPWEPLHGHDAIRNMLKGFMKGVSAIEFVVHKEIEAGEVVMNERTDKFQIKGHWLELPVMGVFEVRDGKIVAWRDYFDAAMFEKQMEKVRAAAQ